MSDLSLNPYTIGTGNASQINQDLNSLAMALGVPVASLEALIESNKVK